MTIHKQYNEYHELKDDLFARINNINKYATIILIMGVTYLVYLTISLFLETIREPFAEIVA